MYNYAVKVRTKAYLWGSSGVVVDLDVPLFLVVHNDAWGDPITVSTDAITGSAVIGTLQPGECWTVPLLGQRGIFATCDTDSTVSCIIITP